MSAKEFSGRDSLKRTDPSNEMGEKSIKQASEWLKRAKDSNILGYRDLAMVASFISMLHAARALLFKDGLKERENRDLIEYIKENYPELRELATSIDQYERLVLAIQRDPDLSIGRGDAKGAMSSADELKKMVEEILSKKS